MSNKPLYKIYLARDFTLVVMEIWERGEVSNPKIWTDEKQPYLPYIISENTGPVVNGYYDFRGIKWIVQLLKERIKKTGNLDFVEIPFRRELKKLKSVYEKPRALNKKDLLAFLKQSQVVWVWFEALWWVWESGLYKNTTKEQSERLINVRHKTQNFVPGLEATVRLSLKKLYPSLGSLIALLSIEEIAGDRLPPTEVLKERAKGYFLVGSEIFIGKNRNFIEKKFNIRLEKTTTSSNKKEFKGQTAFKGIVRGIVKVVYGVRQINKVESGDIIVAPMTLPDFLPAMKKSAAFVTNEGGIICHAAIMARELKKPCIVGTKIATKILKDGDLVEVDASKGVVKILKRAK